jgi:SAM-dependent methyltransferase
VNAEVFERLRTLNHEFYQTFAGRFADKRTRLQPGVRRALESISPKSNILDLGCGHGTLAESLVKRGHQGIYLGLDLSTGMIALARKAIDDAKIHFAQSDLSQSAWHEACMRVPQAFQPPYALALSFATLHHIPSSERRGALVREIFPLLESGSHWVLSVWDFLQSDRLKGRIVPWSQIGLNPGLVEDGDYLLDWRHGGQGLRYVHHFTPEALEQLAGTAGFDVIETFRDDGENRRLGLYQVWRRP